jgi:glutamate synthase domain-containing protein 3
MIEIDADEMTHRTLNENLRRAIISGDKEVRLKNVLGQRFIAAGLRDKVRIEINGIAGNDLAVFMDGPEIYLYGNGEDGVGNTISGGKIDIFGNSGDLLGHSARGGKIFVRGDIGWRGGIHAKSYQDKLPVIIVGGRAGDYLGEYLSGGLIIVLGIPEDPRPLVGKFCGTGMHGGTIYLRGSVPENFLGKEVSESSFSDDDAVLIKPYLTEFCQDFGLDFSEISRIPFRKLVSQTSRPYGRLYAY